MRLRQSVYLQFIRLINQVLVMTLPSVECIAVQYAWHFGDSRCKECYVETTAIAEVDISIFRKWPTVMKSGQTNAKQIKSMSVSF